MNEKALLLNATYEPLRVITWERAVTLLHNGRVDLVEGYADRMLRSVNLEIPWPAVVRLRTYVKTYARIRFNRSNVLARDAYVCGYCGAKPRDKKNKPVLDDLTIDHVIPRAQAKGGTVYLPWAQERVIVTCWKNVTTACYDCNHKKADRTPAEAGMRLVRVPHEPNALDVVRISMSKIRVPDEWKAYVPDEWKDYWTVELED